LPATADIHVQCTDTTTYNVGLDKGLNGGTVSTRQMLGTLNAPFASVNYGLYQEVGHTTNWGETVGVDTKAGTGNGTTQDITVFGLVPVQTSVKPDTYTDTVAITVTY
jgi:spore coat protein U-like protein